MASEIRVNQIQNRSGLSTVTFSDSGVSIAGVTTVGILSATGNSVFSGNVTVSGTISGNVNSTGVSTLTTLGVSGVTTTQHLNVTGVSTFVSVGATSLNVTGVSIFSNGPVFIGSGTSTGTASQPLQVTGGAYVSGSVGIGTTNPTVKLQVLANESGSFNISAAPNASTSTVSIQNTLGDVVLFLGNDNRVSAGLGTLANNGAVITFGGKWSSTLPAANRGFGAIGAYKENNTSANQQGYLSLYTRPSSGNLVERVRIDSSGNVGIGTTNPTEKLEVAGNIKVSVGSSITVGSSFIQNNAVGLGTTSTTGRNAGVSTAQGTLIFNSDTGSVQVYNGNAWRDVGKEAMNATGGLVNEYIEGGRVYRAHIFTSSGFFTVNSASPTETVDYLVVGGGGGGGNTRAGGGGAGGFLAGSGTPVSTNPGVYTISVGGGGNGGVYPNGDATSGNSSSIANPLLTTITSQGGGKGGGRTNPSAIGYPAAPGGSGGGGHVDPAAVTGGTGNRVTGTSTPAPAQGSNGGTNPGGSNDRGSGGGGASQAGDIGGPGSPGKGGDGSPSAITGITTHYAGGGGGGSGPLAPAAGAGGLGGGGAGARGVLGNAPGTPGTFATGGGAGGAADDANGGSGGSGIVVVRYEIGQVGGTAKATGGAISYTPTKTVHTFYSSGDFTVTNPALSSVDYLVVAGGGAGGHDVGGGGGAGGFRTNVLGHPLASPSPFPVTPGPYVVVVGAGGVATPGVPTPPATNGGNSSFSTIISTGGGGGGNYNGGSGLAGGSGGGGSSYSGAFPGGSGNTPPVSPPQGNPGGAGAGPTSSHGGGGGGAGGAGPVGSPGPITTFTPGGAGSSISITGTMVTYATGGKGGGDSAPNPAAGGFGTGNGGDGAGGTSTGSNGGSGIVIIAYPS